MKKFVAAIAALIMCACVLCGCGGSATGGKGTDAVITVTGEQVTNNLKTFLGITDANQFGNLGDRTPTSESERVAAERLYNRYADSENYSDITVTPLSETGFDFTVNGKEYTSQNVEIKFSSPKSTGKQVIIGAAYDNPYGVIDAAYAYQTSTGAFENATGVATVMSIIDYCNANAAELKKTLDFDLVFVFFGCGSYNNYGAKKYISGMNVAALQNTLVMFNISKLGGEKMYLYADETETSHEKFIRGVADNCNLSFYSLPSNMPIIDGVYLEDVYYTHFAMLGDHAAFMEKGVPTAYLFSGYYGGFNLSDLEKKGSKNLGGTENDTYVNLENSRAAYAEQGSFAATLIMQSVISDGFTSAMEKTRASAKDYTFWTNPLWAYLIVIFIIIALGIVIIILVKHFEKKYPFVPTIKRMKIAVFGMDYEKPSDADIFVDIGKKNSPPKNPFDGY